MALNLASPGIQTREVDLTVGRADTGIEQIAGIAGPFEKGPVNTPVYIRNESDLIKYFGKPSTTDNQYEYWYSASNYLSYGGSLRVIRTNNAGLRNANVGTGSTTIKILSLEDYTNTWSDSTSFYFAAKDPGSWGNGLKVCAIDNGADQIIGLTTSNPQAIGAVVGHGVTVALNNVKLDNSQTFTGYLKGVITKVNQGTGNTNSSIEVKILSRVSSATTSYSTTLTTANTLAVGAGATVVYLNSTAGLNTLDTFNVSGIATHIPIVSVGNTFIRLASGVSTSFGPASTVVLDRLITVGGVETEIDYIEKYRASSIASSDTINFIDTSGNSTGSSVPVVSVNDWYNNQTLGLNNQTVYWRNIAPKPKTTAYAKERNGKNDELHVVVVDETGSITGVALNIVEKFIGLSKSTDAVFYGKSIYYKSVIANTSQYIYAGGSETGSKSTITTGEDVLWSSPTTASDRYFNVIGSKSYALSNGKDYSGGVKTFSAEIGDVIESYKIFKNKAEYNLNYLIGGSFNGPTLQDSQAKASALIEIAEERRDCVVTISPHKPYIVDVASSDDQTNNSIEFYGPISSSSYVMFDPGYKYMFNRFENRFDYVPCNSDVAGLMAKTAIGQYPWYSPAGTTRGILNNVIKLAYNPSQSQRDLLYSNRINPIIMLPGTGAVLYGDKTGLREASAFDRINVRNLFLSLESTIENAAKAQLFEFNDIITRANFVNIVEPYLRDVKAKRGISEFLIVCDESNNTPDVIDSNQFKADIYVKPARSINFIGLTFVATRTGVSFDEIAGTV